MTPIDQAKIEELKALIEYRKGCGLLFLIENHGWEGPHLNIKIKGYDTSDNFVAKYLSALDDIAPQLLNDLEASMKEADACNYLIEHLRSVLTESGKETTMLRNDNERLREAVENLLDGLDANGDPERCGLDSDEWRKVIIGARQALASHTAEPKGEK